MLPLALSRIFVVYPIKQIHDNLQHRSAEASPIGILTTKEPHPLCFELLRGVGSEVVLLLLSGP